MAAQSEHLWQKLPPQTCLSQLSWLKKLGRDFEVFFSKCIWSVALLVQGRLFWESRAAFPGSPCHGIALSPLPGRVLVDVVPLPGIPYSCQDLCCLPTWRDLHPRFRSFRFSDLFPFHQIVWALEEMAILNFFIFYVSWCFWIPESVQGKTETGSKQYDLMSCTPDNGKGWELNDL